MAVSEKILWGIITLFGSVSTAMDITQHSGMIQSPTDGDTYSNDLDLRWDIRVDPGFRISLYFTEFDLEDSYDVDKGGPCAYDYLEIEDGEETILKYCGNPKTFPMDAPLLGKEFISNGNTLTLKFITDYSNEEPLPKGFKAHYKEIDRDECDELKQKLNNAYEDWDKQIYCNHHCHNVPGSYYCSCEAGFHLHENRHICTSDCAGKVLTDSEGELTTKTYVERYSKLASCDWIIKQRPGILVEMRFVGEFEIERHEEEGCVYDWLQYEDGTGKTSKRYCGGEKPNNGRWIRTKSHLVKITFQTDLTIEHSGFTLEYRTQRIRCQKLVTAPENGKIISKSKSRYEFEDVITFECNIGYRLMGDTNIVCESSGEWSSAEPICEIKKCKHPKHLDNVKNGRIKNDVISLTYGSNVTVLCFVWYEMTSGVSVWSCEDDETWHEKSVLIAPNENGNVPKCEPICGLKGNKAIREGEYEFGDVIDTTDDPDPLILNQIISGKKAEVGEWPWMVFIDIYRGGLMATEYCGGSLVSPRTVVTAAHCTSITFKEDIIVYVGFNDRSQVEHAHLQVFKVDELVEHDNYSSASFDNDIAILVLNASVKIGKYVRPLCLPRSDLEKSLPEKALTGEENFQKRAVIAGWGYTVFTEAKKIQSVDLMMTRLPPIDQKTCNKNLEHDDLKITDNMICAGFLEGGRDSCQGDSGGPLMFKDPHRSKWFLNGIVSFGSSERCGDRTFGIYTDVARYISWIETFLND